MQNIINAAHSGSYVLFDDYVPRSEKGRQFLIQLKEHIGKRLILDPGIRNRTRNKNNEAAMLFLKDISSDDEADINPSNVPVIFIGSDLDRLEEWHNIASYHPCTVYLFNKEQELVLWSEERAQKRATAIDNLSHRLGNGTCWITTSALNSPRLKNMLSLLDEMHFPKKLKNKIHILDISKEKAKSIVPVLIEALEEQCGPAIPIGEHIPVATEQEILAMLVHYAQPECNVYILVANEADSNAISATYRNMYNEELAPSTFVSISWYGALMPPRWIAAKQQTEVNSRSSAFLPGSVNTLQTPTFPTWSTTCTVTELAETLSVKPFKLISELLPFGVFASPSSILQPSLICKLWDKHIPSNITIADLAIRLSISQSSLLETLHSLGIYANPSTVLNENQTRMIGERLLYNTKYKKPNASFTNTPGETEPATSPLDLMTDSPTLLRAAEEDAYMTKTELTNWLKETPLRLRLFGANTKLTTEQVRQLCKNITPEEPSSDYVFKVGGPKWGQMLKAGVTCEDIRNKLENPYDREMCIAYSRRWGRPDVASHLLKQGFPLSLYCIRNWLKNGQNAKEKRTLMETILNDAFYENFKEIIASTPNIQQASDVIHMLNIQEQTTNVQICIVRIRELKKLIEKN